MILKVDGPLRPVKNLTFFHPLSMADACDKRYFYSKEYCYFHIRRFVLSSFCLIIIDFSWLKYVDFRVENCSEISAQDFL